MGQRGMESDSSRPDRRPYRNEGLLVKHFVREGDAWKFRMETWNITTAPAAPAQTNGAQEQSTVDPQVRQQLKPYL